MNQQPPVSMMDPRSAEQRSAHEPALEGSYGIANFPELQNTTHGSSRAKGIVRIILRDFLPKPEVKAALIGKLARGISSPAHQNGSSSEGYPLLLDAGGLDSRAIFQSYLDGSSILDPEDIKGILFAIRRECNRMPNDQVFACTKLADLTSFAIFELQQQRRIDTSTVQLKL